MNLFPIVLILVPLVVSGLVTFALVLIIASAGFTFERLVALALFGSISGYLAYLLAKTCRPEGSLVQLPEGVEVDLDVKRRLSHLVLLPFYALAAGAVFWGLAQAHSIRYWVGVVCLVLALWPLQSGLGRLRAGWRQAPPDGSRQGGEPPRWQGAAGLVFFVAFLVAKAVLWYWILGLARYISLFDLLGVVFLFASLTFALVTGWMTRQRAATS